MKKASKGLLFLLLCICLTSCASRNTWHRFELKSKPSLVGNNLWVADGPTDFYININNVSVNVNNLGATYIEPYNWTDGGLVIRAEGATIYVPNESLAKEWRESISKYQSEASKINNAKELVPK